MVPYGSERTSHGGRTAPLGSIGRGHLTMARTKRLFRVRPLTRRALYIPHPPRSFHPLRPPPRPFIPSAGVAREIADRNFSNFPNGSFLAGKSTGQLKETSCLEPSPSPLLGKWERGHIPNYSLSIQYLRYFFYTEGATPVLSEFWGWR